MKKITILLITLLLNGVIMAQLPANSFFEFEFTGGSLNNTSSSGAPNFTGSITAIADRNASVNDAVDITGVLSGASVGATNVNEMTLTFWMKHDPITSGERIIQIYGTGGKGFKLEMNGSQLVCNATIGGGGSSSIITTHSQVVSIDNSAWHHIVIRTTLINAATIEYDIFLDNVPVSNLSNQTLDIEDYQNGLSITNFLSSANLVVSPTNNYSGDIDDIYFYKSALTDAEITQIYNYSPSPCTVTIPDANFKAYLVGNTAINTNGNTEIECSEAANFTGQIDCSFSFISDLTGIEAFTAIVYLDCSNNQLTSLDVTNNTALINLYGGFNQITSLDLSANTALAYFSFHANQLTSLDVTSTTTLSQLSVQGNQLTSLVIGMNNISNNLNATNNPNLTCIQVDDVAYSTSNWTNIDTQTSFSTNCNPPCTVTIPDANFKSYLVGNTAINSNGNAEIECSEAAAFTDPMYATGMGIADLTGIEAFTGINVVHITSNLLTSVDLSQNTALSILKCAQNQLSTLDLSMHPLLYNLDATQNLLTTIDLTANSGLSELNLTLNQISSIDLSNLVDLTVLKIADNNLSNLTLTSNVALQELICKGNQIIALDISGLPVFAKMRCDDNSLTSLNLANGNNSNYSYMIAGANPYLTCIQVDDVGYSTTNWTSLDATVSFSTNCSPILVSSITIQGQGGTSTITAQNGTLQMEATILPVNADDLTYTWSVTNGTGSASIDVNGLLTALTDGTVEIIAATNDGSGIIGMVTITISNQSLSVNEIDSQTISIYPNPVQNELFVVLKNQQITKMDVLDLSGKVVLSINTTVNSINISDLNQGVYILKLYTQNSVANTRFVKQ